MVDVIARGLAARGGGGSGDSYTKAEIDAMLLNKQNVLVSGENIKTVNGNSLLGAGNVTIATRGPAEGMLRLVDNKTLSTGVEAPDLYRFDGVHITSRNGNIDSVSLPTAI